MTNLFNLLFTQIFSYFTNSDTMSSNQFITTVLAESGEFDSSLPIKIFNTLFNTKEVTLESVQTAIAYNTHTKQSEDLYNAIAIYSDDNGVMDKNAFITLFLDMFESTPEAYIMVAPTFFSD